jgi:hypothetical protein
MGAVLSVCKEKLSPEVFSKVQDTVPGADDAMKAADAGQESSGGGLLGAVSGLAGKIFGGGGAAAGLLAKLGDLGFSTEQLQSFLPNMLEF